MRIEPHPLVRPVSLAAALLLATGACAGPSAAPTDPRATPTLTSGATGPREPASASAGPSAEGSTVRTLPQSPRPPAALAAGIGPSPLPGVVRPAPDLVDLVRADGSPFRLADERGHRTLLFFGYTHCPDVCPATIGELIGVVKARPDVRVVFITVDPERDTPEFLAEWTRYLPEGLIGVTGSPAAIRRAADLYGVRYARVHTGSAAGYAMSHTAFQYLVDEQGDLLATYPFGTPAAAIIGDLAKLDRAR